MAVRLSHLKTSSSERPSRLNPDVPRALDRVCLRALSFAAENRQPDAGAFVDELRQALESRHAKPMPWLWALAGLVLVLLVGLVVGLTIGDGDSASESKTPAPEASESSTKTPAPSTPPKQRSEWVRVATAAAPSARIGHQAVYDPLRRQVVVFGGWSRWGGRMFNDTWGWNGSRWELLGQRGMAPSHRHSHAMAFDARRGRVVLFGGYDKQARGRRLSDLWEWDGRRWQRVSQPRARPKPRAWHAMTWDSKRQQVLLFGGNLGRTPSGALWSWDGRQWRRLQASGATPRPRSNFAMAFDDRRGVLVVHGGDDTSKRRYGDLWEWDGARWRQPDQGATKPGVRTGHSMVFAGEQVLLFGGKGTKGTGRRGDLWGWDGVRWVQRQSATPPGKRSGQVLAWDPDRRVLVLFGGGKKERRTLADTWEYRIP